MSRTVGGGIREWVSPLQPSPPPPLVVDGDLAKRVSEQHSSDSIVKLHDFVPYGLMAPRRSIILLIWTLLLAGSWMPGCGEGQQRRYDDAVLALRDGRNETALAESRRVVSSSDPTLRCDAALVAGVAATRVGATADARRYLKIAATSSDARVAGRAMVQQGVLERQEGRRLEAAESFERAADRLGPDEAGRALLLAAEDYEAVGDIKPHRKRVYAAMVRALVALASQTKVLWTTLHPLRSRCEHLCVTTRPAAPAAKLEALYRQP